MKTENYPIVKLLFPYAIGILIAYYADFAESTRPILLILTGVFYLTAFLLTFVKAYRWRAVQTTVMNAAFIMAGILLTDMRLHPTLSVEWMENNPDWMVRVAEEPTLRKKSVKVPAEILHTVDNQLVKTTVLLYLGERRENRRQCRYCERRNEEKRVKEPEQTVGFLAYSDAT